MPEEHEKLLRTVLESLCNQTELYYLSYVFNDHGI